jgi:hypothetical protein
MAKKRTPPPPPPAPEPAPERPSVTPDRFNRLYRLLQFLGSGPKTRERLTRHLELDVRGFYRDLELLRAAGIEVTLTMGRYGLSEDAEDAVARLPFPDPRLTLGEARRLARGRTLAHRHLQQQIDRATS